MITTPAPSIVAAFADASLARQAAAALHASGIEPEHVTVVGDAGSARIPVQGRPDERESPFLVRLVLIIVFWSIIGTAIGVVMGIVFGALGIGPQGTAGLVIQIVSWAIFAHLMAGLWAGYALLANRSEPMTPAITASAPATRVLVRVSCAESAMPAVEAILRSHGATSIGRYAADGTLIQT